MHSEIKQRLEEIGADEEDLREITISQNAADELAEEGLTILENRNSTPIRPDYYAIRVRE